MKSGTITKGLDGLGALTWAWRKQPYIEIIPNDKEACDESYQLVKGTTEICAKRSTMTYLEMREKDPLNVERCPAGTVSCSKTGELCVKTISDCPVSSVHLVA